jgi:hypothetical protein
MFITAIDVAINKGHHAAEKEKDRQFQAAETDKQYAIIEKQLEQAAKDHESLQELIKSSHDDLKESETLLTSVVSGNHGSGFNNAGAGAVPAMLTFPPNGGMYGGMSGMPAQQLGAFPPGAGMYGGMGGMPAQQLGAYPPGAGMYGGMSGMPAQQFGAYPPGAGMYGGMGGMPAQQFGAYPPGAGMYGGGAVPAIGMLPLGAGLAHGSGATSLVGEPHYMSSNGFVSDEHVYNSTVKGVQGEIEDLNLKMRGAVDKGIISESEAQRLTDRFNDRANALDDYGTSESVNKLQADVDRTFHQFDRLENIDRQGKSVISEIRARTEAGEISRDTASSLIKDVEKELGAAKAAVLDTDNVNEDYKNASDNKVLGDARNKLWAIDRELNGDAADWGNPVDGASFKKIRSEIGDLSIALDQSVKDGAMSREEADRIIARYSDRANDLEKAMPEEDSADARHALRDEIQLTTQQVGQFGDIRYKAEEVVDEIRARLEMGEISQYQANNLIGKVESSVDLAKTNVLEGSEQNKGGFGIGLLGLNLFAGGGILGAISSSISQLDGALNNIPQPGGIFQNPMNPLQHLKPLNWA